MSPYFLETSEGRETPEQPTTRLRQLESGNRVNLLGHKETTKIIAKIADDNRAWVHAHAHQRCCLKIGQRKINLIPDQVFTIETRKENISVSDYQFEDKEMSGRVIWQNPSEEKH